MPIRPEFRKFYYCKAWDETRKRIRERAGDKCEQCGVPNHARVVRVGGNWYDVTASIWRNPRGELVPRDRIGAPEVPRYTRGLGVYLMGVDQPQYRRLVRIACHCAHLNHTPGDDRDENLKFLCSWCHLNYDKLHHKETRSVRKDGERPLLFQEAI